LIARKGRIRRMEFSGRPPLVPMSQPVVEALLR
jgi:hypothetical protein